MTDILKKDPGPSRGLGEFPLPPSSKEKKPKESEEQTEPTPLIAPTATSLDSDEPEITDEQRERFLKAILSETPYTESIEVFDGAMTVTLRTRQVWETDLILEEVKNAEPEAAIDVEMIMSKANLAYALVSLEIEEGVETFDSPDRTLEQRLQRIQQFPTAKFTVLINLLAKFDRKVYALSEEATKPDFLSTGDAA